MRPVAVIGIGKTPFGAFPDRDLRSLAVEAGEKCLKNGHTAPAQVDAFFLGNFAGPFVRGPESPGAVRFHCPRHSRHAGDARGGGLRFERFGLFPRV